MQNHYYDEAHPWRPYTHSLPATPGASAPINALRGDAPVVKPGFWPCELDGQWVDVKDHRGEAGWRGGEPHVIDDIGPRPGGWTDTPPPGPEYEWDGAGWIVNPVRKLEIESAKIRAELDRLDGDSIRPLRAIDAGTGTEDDHAKLTRIEEEAARLREELAALGSGGISTVREAE